MKSIKETLETSYSLNQSEIYINRNLNNKVKLQTLYNIIKGQNDLVKNHGRFKIHSQLTKKLEIKTLNLENYKFYNRENEIAQLNLKKNKKYLLDLWFTNSPPCIRDHKVISKKLKWLEGNNIELIGISTDKKNPKWKKYLESNHYNWKNYREVDSLKTITEDLAISAFPTYILIENSGEIKISSISFSDIENYLNKK